MEVEFNTLLGLLIVKLDEEHAEIQRFQMEHEKEQMDRYLLFQMMIMSQNKFPAITDKAKGNKWQKDVEKFSESLKPQGMREEKGANVPTDQLPQSGKAAVQYNTNEKQMDMLREIQRREMEEKKAKKKK